MAFPGNAAAVPIKALYFPPGGLSGPGFGSAFNLRPYHGGKHPEYRINYYPALRHFFVEHLSPEGNVKESGWMWEGLMAWWEVLEE